MKINAINMVLDTRPKKNKDSMVDTSTQNKFILDLTKGKYCFASPGGLGDSIMLTPIFRLLKRKMPNFKIEFAVRPTYMQTFAGNPYIDYLFDAMQLLQNPEIKRHYDFIFDFSHAITNNPEAEHMHAVDACFKWFDKDFDLNTLTERDRLPALVVNNLALSRAKQFLKFIGFEEGIIIALQLRASSIIRSWLPEYNKALGRELGKLGYKVLLFNPEKDSCLWFTGDNVEWVRHQMIRNMQELIALLSLCDFIVGPDSSFLWIAQAFNIPCLGLFGAIPPKKRLGYYKYGYYLGGDKEFAPCIPCYHHKGACSYGSPSICMESITPDMVLSAIEELIKKYPPHRDKKLDTPEQKTCPYCSTFKDTPLDSTDHELADYAVCSGCKTVFKKGGKPKFREQIYDTEVLRPHYEHAANRIDEVASKFLSTKDLVYVLDIDSGAGLVEYFLSKNPKYKVTSIDLDNKARQIGREKLGVDVLPYSLIQGDVLFKNYFNVIVLNDYFPYIANSDLELLFRKIPNILWKDEGLLYITIPNQNGYNVKEFCKNQKPMAFPTKEAVITFLASHRFKTIQTEIQEYRIEIIAERMK